MTRMKANSLSSNRLRNSLRKMEHGLKGSYSMTFPESQE